MQEEKEESSKISYDREILSSLGRTEQREYCASVLVRSY